MLQRVILLTGSGDSVAAIDATIPAPHTKPSQNPPPSTRDIAKSDSGFIVSFVIGNILRLSSSLGCSHFVQLHRLN